MAGISMTPPPFQTSRMCVPCIDIQNLKILPCHWSRSHSLHQGHVLALSLSPDAPPCAHLTCALPRRPGAWLSCPSHIREMWEGCGLAAPSKPEVTLVFASPVGLKDVAALSTQVRRARWWPVLCRFNQVQQFWSQIWKMTGAGCIKPAAKKGLACLCTIDHAQAKHRARAQARELFATQSISALC